MTSNGVLGSTSIFLPVASVGDSIRRTPNLGELNTIAAISTVFSSNPTNPQTLSGINKGEDSLA